MNSIILSIVIYFSAAHTKPNKILVDQIITTANQFAIDPILEAILIGHESTMRQHVVSKQGARGYGQILPRSIATRGWNSISLTRLESTKINLFLTARHMAWCRARCRSSPPEEWLSLYNGHKKCRSSSYSRSIMKDYRRIISEYI